MTFYVQKLLFFVHFVCPSHAYFKNLKCITTGTAFLKIDTASTFSLLKVKSFILHMKHANCMHIHIYHFRIKIKEEVHVIQQPFGISTSKYKGNKKRFKICSSSKSINDKSGFMLICLRSLVNVFLICVCSTCLCVL